MPVVKQRLRVPTKLEIGELRRLKNPPVSVRRCLELAVLVINAEKFEAILVNGHSIRVDWERDVLRTLVDFETIITAMTDVKKTTDHILAAPALRRYVTLTYLDGPEPLTHAKVQRSSGPAGVVLGWLSECLSQAAAQEAAVQATAGTSANQDSIQGKVHILAADKQTIIVSPQTAMGISTRIAKGVDNKGQEGNPGAASIATLSSTARGAADGNKKDTEASAAAAVINVSASDEKSAPQKAPLKASLVMSAQIEACQEPPREADQMCSSAMYDEKLEPEAPPRRRALVKQRSQTAAAAQKLLRDAEDRKIKEEERELASRGLDDVPPPGSPPKHKMTTVGALVDLLPKDQTADPQQSLMMALSAPVPGKKPSKKDTGPCDKCDGKHATDDCPHYPNSRDTHADAWSSYGSKKKSGQGDEAPSAFVLKGARVVPQPGDGSCMFHSLAYCIGGNTCATTLRKDIAQYIADHPDLCIGGTPIQDWVLWDSGLSIKDYTARMATGNHWGGAIELAVCVLVRNVLVYVYESAGNKRGEYTRISIFGDDDGSDSSSTSRHNINKHGGGAPDQRIVHILYSGRVHYDALVNDRYRC